MPCSCVADDAAVGSGFQDRRLPASPEWDLHAALVAVSVIAHGPRRPALANTGSTSTGPICYRSRMVPDAIDLAGVRRVLVTKLRHHGDVLLTAPVLSTL